MYGVYGLASTPSSPYGPTDLHLEGLRHDPSGAAQKI